MAELRKLRQRKLHVFMWRVNGKFVVLDQEVVV